MKKYIPIKREFPPVIDVTSAWGNIPTILGDLIERLNLRTSRAIEFGVEYGYSTSALAHYFEEVVGVDTFVGDHHAGFKGDLYEEAKNLLSVYKNITLLKESYQSFIEKHEERFDLAHVDIVHTYEDTYNCGEWCIKHAEVSIFHDTMSFPDVFRACQDLSNNFNLEFYNYEESNGLGILVSKSL
jgi:hypothetical protein